MLLEVFELVFNKVTSRMVKVMLRCLRHVQVTLKRIRFPPQIDRAPVITDAVMDEIVKRGIFQNFNQH
ncbi:hypothetical protein T01_2976 [Trichinella spiralis]|uniref:Uncharacterized protein n=1 Tax=Trichinella spiralis TaxID=6334 RepID=A0A0V1AUK9_TRISP|nr:hypothetical protein T01_2976 [Trichinella spiralis]